MNGSTQVTFKNRYSVIPVPSQADIQWIAIPDNFKIGNVSNGVVEVTPLGYNVSATLHAKLFYNKVMADGVSKQISSPALALIGSGNISCCVRKHTK